MTAPVLTNDNLFEGFDKVAERLGIKPPTSPGEQVVVATMLQWFFLGARWYQHVQEHLESTSPEFSLPGIDFDAGSVMEEIERAKKKH